MDSYFEEYLNYGNGTETRYELIDGECKEFVEMPLNRDRNAVIALYLLVF